MRAYFSKTGDMRFVSHLDLIRLFQRASRRAGLGVAMTKGFSPRLKIAITRALKLGVESKSEEIVFYMDEDLKPQDFMEALNRQLPSGITIWKAEY